MNYARVVDQGRAAIDGPGDRAEKAGRVAGLIRSAGNYRWVGLYDANRHEVSIIAWSGPGAPAWPRFPADKGLTGEAIRSRASVVVNDVAKDPRYLTAFGNTGSEMIVPILEPSLESVIGTIDVESVRVNAFSDEDRALAEQCAAVLIPLFTERSMA